MRVCYVSPFYPPEVREADRMLAAWPLLSRLPPELAALGHDVTVLAHATKPDRRTIAGVDYRFIDAGRPVRALAGAVHRWKARHGPAYYLPAFRLTRALRAARPDVVHVAGMTLDLQLAQIIRACRRPAVPIVVHYHGGTPDRGRLRRLQRRNLAAISRALVTTREQAEPWISEGLLGWEQVAQVVETSSPFDGIDRGAARAMTGMCGDPVYLSTGRLHPIKDPLTMLRGFARIAAAQPDARLYAYYLTDELLPRVRELLGETPTLAARVELRGRADLEEMEAIYSSADFLLQASLREWSGLAVLEAMSCGCVPIVSDIPSFRTMTGDGKAGRLFPAGDPGALARVALAVSDGDRSRMARQTKEYFENELSFKAMARRIDGVYRDVRPDVARPVDGES
jgi:glycosyltransferase involved in cell wall biosynthesis